MRSTPRTTLAESTARSSRSQRRRTAPQRPLVTRSAPRRRPRLHRHHLRRLHRRAVAAEVRSTGPWPRLRRACLDAGENAPLIERASPVEQPRIPDARRHAHHDHRGGFRTRAHPRFRRGSSRAAGPDRLPARGRRARPGDAGLRSRSRDRGSACRDRRHAADVRGRAAFLVPGPAVGAPHRASGCNRADRGRHGTRRGARDSLGLESHVGHRVRLCLVGREHGRAAARASKHAASSRP